MCLDFKESIRFDPSLDDQGRLTYDVAVCVLWTGNEMETMDADALQARKYADKLASLMSQCRVAVFITCSTPEPFHIRGEIYDDRMGDMLYRFAKFGVP